MAYHQPVLLAECIEGLKMRTGGVYVDATFGGGGHSRAILERLGDKGRLFAFDQDADSSANLPVDPRLIFIQANFRYLGQYMDYYGVEALAGVMADLGVSSWQFDNPGRGFSYRFDERLDMRMNRSQPVCARDIVNGYAQAELQQLFSTYGQVRNARTLAEVIVKSREHSPVESTGQLIDIIEPVVRGQRMRYFSQVFQALRIEVNDEIGALKDLLVAATDRLESGGRLVVLSYHSLEDQLVKRWMRSGNFEGVVAKDDFGNPVRSIRAVTKKPVVPGENEIAENVRARSAKMRIAEKL